MNSAYNEQKREASVVLEESKAIVVHADELNAAVNYYRVIKKEGFLHPLSSHFKKLKQYYANLKDKNGVLSSEDLIWLLNFLVSVEKSSATTSSTKKALGALLAKLKPVMDFLKQFPYLNTSTNFLTVFQYPDLPQFITTAVASLQLIMPKSSFEKSEQHLAEIYELVSSFMNMLPLGLKVIAVAKGDVEKFLSVNPNPKFFSFIYTKEFCQAILKNKQLENLAEIIQAIIELQLHDHQIYSAFHYEKDHITEFRALLKHDRNCLKAEYSHRVVDDRINKEYRGKLNSKKNHDLIIQHGRYAFIILNALIHLHRAVIGSKNQKDLENIFHNIFNSDPNEGVQFANAICYLPANLLKKYCSFLLANPKNAYKLAIGFRELNRLGLSQYDNLINNNPAKVTTLTSIIKILHRAYLLENFANEIYINAKLMTKYVPQILEKMDASIPSQLSKANVALLFSHLPLSASILAELGRGNDLRTAIKNIKSAAAVKNYSVVCSTVLDHKEQPHSVISKLSPTG